MQFLVKGNLANKINFLCIDKRERDAKTNQINIVLEDGKRVLMPIKYPKRTSIIVSTAKI